MHRRLVYIYLLNVPSFSSRHFNKIKRTSRLGRLLALSLEILQNFEAEFSLESQPQNLEFRHNPENFHSCLLKAKIILVTKLVPQSKNGIEQNINVFSMMTCPGF